MKKGLVILAVLLASWILPIPGYEELNNLAIIEGIGISFENEKYTVWLKEIIPVKEEQGINYHYKFYEGTATSVEKAMKKIEKNTRKKLYLKRSKFLAIDFENSSSIIKKLNIEPKNIYHPTEKIKEFLEKTKT